MVITPKDAKESLNQKLAPVFKDLEKQIDSALMQAGGKRTSISINIGYNGPYDRPRENIPRSAIDEFLDIYRNAGWHAKYCSDQRDGEWIEFSPAAQKRTENSGLCGISSSEIYD